MQVVKTQGTGHREKCREAELARGLGRRKRSRVTEMEEERVWGCDKGQRAKKRKAEQRR